MKDFWLSFWRGLFSNGGSPDSPSRVYQCEEELLQAVRDLAAQEERPEEDVTADLLSLIQIRKEANELLRMHWNLLSYREQQVTALTCLKYTNQQIAVRLNISSSTVASHIRNVLHEFEQHSKVELRQTLSGWDFSAWEDVC